MDPSITFWALIVFLFGILIWFVGKKLYKHWISQKDIIHRQRMEDSLKLIFNLSRENCLVDQYRLAVELQISLATAQALIADLQDQQLILVDPNHSLSLTLKGQQWALQVIRAHRLWERYLADEARMPLEQVHTAAHRREHQMSLEEVNTLDADMGHPARDPHGDPIPNAAGVLRDDRASVPLVKMKPGQMGQISHLEDEPPLAYAQLLAEGIFVGQSILVQENDSSRVVLSNEEGEYILAPSIAENVSVTPEAIREQIDPEVIPLGDLLSNLEAEIIRIDDRCQGFTRRRFLDLGLTPGTMILPELDNTFHDPRAYRVRGTLIALRREQSNMIWVRPVRQAASL